MTHELRFPRAVLLFRHAAVLFVTCFSVSSLLSSTASFAFNCKVAKTVEEKLVCENKQLLELDRSLNTEYKNLQSTKDVNKADLLDNQKQWFKNTLEKNSPSSTASTLTQQFQARIEQLKISNGSLPIKTVKEPVSSPKPEGYGWAEKQINGKTLIRYPYLNSTDSVQNQNSINKMIESQVEELATDAAQCAYRNLGGLFNQYSFSIGFLYKDFAVLTFDDKTEGCLCGCAHPRRGEPQKFVYDLRSGKDVSGAWAKPFSIKKEKAVEFWSAVFSRNSQQLAHCEGHQDVQAFVRDGVDFDFTLSEGKIYLIPLLGKSNLDCEETARLEVPIQEVQTYIVLDPSLQGRLN